PLPLSPHSTLFPYTTLFRSNILGGYDRLATTLGVCLATEVVLSRLLRGRVANVSSAYITGISLALLIKPQANILWPFALGAFLRSEEHTSELQSLRHLVCRL